MKKVGVALAALGLAGVAALPALADSGEYIGPAAVAGWCPFPATSGTGLPTDDVTVPGFGIGGTCFLVPQGAATATVTVTDGTTGDPVPFLVHVNGRHSGSIGTDQLFCSGSGSVTLWPDAGYLAAGPAGPDLAALYCHALSVTGKGTVTVSFA